MAPTGEGLDADDASGRGLDQWLILEKELFRPDGVAQVVAQADAGAYLGVHRIGEEAIGAPSLGLGAIERHVGTGQQGLGVGGVGPIDGDTDAGAAPDLVAADDVGLAQAGEQPIGEQAGVGRILDVGLHDGEFVAAEAGHRIAFPDGAAQALGHQLEERIADRMSHGVVDVLEMIEVDVEQGEPSRAFLGGGDSVLEGFGEHGAVGEARQAVETASCRIFSAVALRSVMSCTVDNT